MFSIAFPATRPRPGTQALETTGIAAIDAARQSVVAGEWKKAIEPLDPRVLPAEPRTQALASLYRGIVQSESGLGTAEQAAESFSQAFRQLDGGRPADLFLLRNNAGSHVLNQAQDRLYNHAFLMATGGAQAGHEHASLVDEGRGALLVRASSWRKNSVPASKPRLESTVRGSTSCWPI